MKFRHFFMIKNQFVSVCLTSIIKGRLFLLWNTIKCDNASSGAISAIAATHLFIL